MATRGRHGTNGETWGRPASSLWVTPASAQVPVHYRSAAAVLGFAGCAGENANEGHKHRDARLRCRLAQLPFRQADDRRRASSAGASSTRASARRASAPSSSGLPPRVVGQPVGEHERIYAELYCATRPGRRRHRRPGAWAPSRTRCSTPRPRRSACPATNCSAARCATASGCTGRIAPPGASIIRRYYKPAITDLDGVKAIGREVREKGFRALKTNIFIYEAGDKNPRGWRPGFGVPFYARAQRRPQRAAQPAHAPRSHPRRRRAGRRPAARPQLQRQDRGLSQDPARDRRPRHVLDRDRQLQPRGAGLHPRARARIRSARARRCSACASSCPTSASRRWTSPSSTRPGTACGSR